MRGILDGDHKKACQLHLTLGILSQCSAWLSYTVKAAMNMLGFNVGECHLPLVEMSEAHKEYVKNELTKYGLLK